MIKKILILSLIFILVVTGVFFITTPKKTKNILRVMTYSSFAGVFGPGKFIAKEFEQNCKCQIQWIKIPDSTLFIQRLKLKKDGFKTDVIMGLDQISLKAAGKLQWKPITDIHKSQFIPPIRNFVSEKFIPYNWSPMTFISKKHTETISLKNLLEPQYKNNISLPSPQLSTAGLQFYYWFWYVFREKTFKILESFKNQLYGLPPSWSASYSLFQRGHVNLSFSYLSSLLYHKQQKQKDFYALVFKEGHPFQVEFAGVSSFCTQCRLAVQFVHFLQTPKIQLILKQKNYMFPVNLSIKEIDDTLSSFSSKFIPYGKDLDVFLKTKQDRLKQWDLIIKK